MNPSKLESMSTLGAHGDQNDFVKMKNSKKSSIAWLTRASN